MKLLFSTHGETLENINNIIEGQQPGTLSSRGIQQAKNLAEMLKYENLDYIFTSSLKRCIDTAKEVAKYHPDAIYQEDDRLRARRLGQLEGQERNDEEWDFLPGNYYTKKPIYGETLLDAWERVEHFYREVCALPQDTTMYVCAHGETMIILEGLLREIPIHHAFRGHDGTNIIPKIFEPEKGELICYEFDRCEEIKDMFNGV